MPDMPTKLAMVTMASELIVGSSVSKVVSRAIKTYVPAKNNLETVQIFIGSAAISGILVKHANKNVEDKILAAAAFIEAVNERVAEKKAAEGGEDVDE